ncbi:NTP transferase domain-containing protein [Rhodococcus sp. ARC_M6]|uniref:nucleotidyltransferase family protein n=1 Tax=Rhodococcus sp. ARC_M6 TaxID=2928852 RepID=UPI001FB523CC|nr:nucleotidyltransferase family protein [Rhodococcus sp. ARC_M6]MCJ0906377.1 nucleotidyltransferase family protein [Rhodococcus sp. ARC_M6]
MTTCGILLAAGAGSRMGTPKALMVDADGSWLCHGVSVLLGVGCTPVIVVLGAQASDATALLPSDSTNILVVESDWQKGMSASLHAGLDAAHKLTVDAAVVTLVDLPDLNAGTVARMVGPTPVQPNTLRRAVFHGSPGHPVVIGRDHWDALINSLTGDAGAGAYLREHRAELVECSDLSTGQDVDYPPA